jgi:hypothetical protein
MAREAIREARKSPGQIDANNDLRNTLLNHTNPGVASLHSPEGFSAYFQGVSQTEKGLREEMAAVGINPSDGIPEHVTQAKFMGSLATLLNGDTALPPDLNSLTSEYGQSPLTPVVARTILDAGYEPDSGAFHAVNAAIRTIQDIDTGAIQLTRQEIQTQFGKHLRQSRTEK